jgi:hypothetical protein
MDNLSNDTARDLLDFLDQSTYVFQGRLKKSFQNQIAKSAGFTITGLDVSLSDTPEIPASTFWDVFSVYRQADSIRLQHKALGFTLSRSSILILLCAANYIRAATSSCIRIGKGAPTPGSTSLLFGSSSPLSSVRGN